MPWAQMIAGTETIAAMTMSRAHKGLARANAFMNFSENRAIQQRFCNPLRPGTFINRSSSETSVKS
jgi:hypothetical protein